MPVLYHCFFVILYTMVAAIYGRTIQWMEVSPDVMLPVFVYLLRKTEYPHLIYISLLSGLANDLLNAHPWALSATFYIIMHLVLFKLKITFWLNSFFMYVLTLAGLSILSLAWERLCLDQPLSFNKLYAFTLLTTITGMLVYFIFKLIHLGWGTGSARNRAPVLNG